MAHPYCEVVMSDPKSDKAPASTPDQLVSSGITASEELSDQQMEGVAGGQKVQIQQDVTVNKAKTADKAFSAMDGYIRG
jgi:hypothetical protein